MIVGIGVDVVDIERFGRQLERTPGLRDRLFVPCRARAEHPVPGRAVRGQGSRGQGPRCAGRHELAGLLDRPGPATAPPSRSRARCWQWPRPRASSAGTCPSATTAGSPRPRSWPKAEPLGRAATGPDTMISAYTGTQVRAAEQPLLAAGHGRCPDAARRPRPRQRRRHASCGPAAGGSTAPAWPSSPARATTAETDSSPPPSWPPAGMRTTAVLTGGAAHPEALAAFERAGGRVHVLTDANASRAGRGVAACRRRH